MPASLIRGLATLHDAVTDLGRIVGAVALGTIVFSYCYEVFVRYVLNAPTTWANELVSYAFCVSIFMTLPHVTRAGGHVAVTILVDSLPARFAAPTRWLASAAGFLLCAVAAWMSLDETMRQIADDVRVMAVHPIPKWWISSFIAYGFAMSAFSFLRTLGTSTSNGGSGSEGL